MGIQGLIPFLKKASRQVNIKDYAGCTVAIDAYCWIHKGAFGCAEKLGKGEKTDGYVYYCMKLINSLLSMNIIPIMVFDGCNLPAKAGTEAVRRESREKNRKNAKEFLRKGQLKEARECFQRSVDVTPEMALEVIQACHKKGVDCIVAPYEADAQLAYLSRSGIAHIIITEDSDLVLFGCEKILFKMDASGNGVLVEKSRLNLCMGMKTENFTFEKFRYMCIMSGCDYLPSLPGIGLQKSCKFFSRTTIPDLNIVLSKIPFYLNMSSITVTKQYIDGFIRANNTFLYQLAFDPTQRKLVPLTPYPPDVNPADLEYAGKYIPDDIAYEMALGNINVKTKETMHNFNPDKHITIRKASSWEKASSAPCSMWSPQYKPRKFTAERPSKDKSAFVCEKRPPTKAKEVVVNTDKLRKRAAKQLNEQLDDAALNEEMHLVDLYCEESPLKKSKSETNNIEPEATPEKIIKHQLCDIPLCHKTSDKTSNRTSDPLPRNSFISPINKFKVTSTPKVAVRSRFFSSSDDKTPAKQKPKGALDWFEQIAMEYEVGSPIPTGRNEKTVDIRGVLNSSGAGVSNQCNLSSKQTERSPTRVENDNRESPTCVQNDKPPPGSPVFNSSISKSKQQHPSFAWKKLEKFSFKADIKPLTDSPKSHSTFKPVQPDTNKQHSGSVFDDSICLDDLCDAVVSQDTEQNNSDYVCSGENEFFNYTDYSSVRISHCSEGHSSQTSEVLSEELNSSGKSCRDEESDEVNDSFSPVFNTTSIGSAKSSNFTNKREHTASFFTSPQNAVMHSGTKRKSRTPQSCRRTGLSKKAKTKVTKENGLRQLSIGETLQQFLFKKNTLSCSSYFQSRSPLTSVNTDTITISD